MVFAQPSAGIFFSIIFEKLVSQMKHSVFCSCGIQPLYHAIDHRQPAECGFNASKRHCIFQSHDRAFARATFAFHKDRVG
jgi:hypothetical protein